MQADSRVQLERQKETIHARINDLHTKKIELSDNEVQWKKIADTVTDLETKHTKVIGAVSKYTIELQRHKHTQDFFTKHDNCPLCTQSIELSLKNTQLQTTSVVIAETEQKLAEAESLEKLLQKKLTTARDAVVTLRQMQTEYQSLGRQIASYEAQLQEVDGQIQATYTPPPTIDMNIATELAEATDSVNKIYYEKLICEQCIGLLKDNGIRTKVIQQYLPVINGWVNHYLRDMNFPIQFMIDDQFKEIIKSRNRDEFSYENLSDGERRRVDLALVLTWRTIAKMKNSVFTNLLVFDEIFDSSLDSAGTDDFLRLMETMDVDTNVFVISHKVDALIDRFKSVIMVTKDRGFSVVKQL
jgi:DNA repair exonuclease SbcCD ATPase subunit